MSCAISQLILESIRTWMTSTQSIKVLAGIELRWIEVDALAAWPALDGTRRPRPDAYAVS